MTKFTKREKVLLVFLILIVIGLGWYKLVYEPVNAKIDEFVANKATEEDLILSKMPKVNELHQMEEALVELRKKGEAQKMPLFDNSRPLMVKLNKVMADVENYSVSFGIGDTDDYMVYRSINLNYSVPNYEACRNIIERLAEETYVNQISDVSIGTSGNGEGGTTATLSILFFEVAN